VDWLFPPDFAVWLRELRTPSIEVKGRGSLKLEMLSTMGNGTTFPIQTLLFSAVVVATQKVLGTRVSEGPPWVNELWGVFGDDIICPRAISDRVISTLKILGFKLNYDKTFTEGPFRESCGADYHVGYNVRPVFLKETLDAPHALYSAINRLIRWSVKTGLELPRTLEYLIGSLPTVLLVPRSFDYSSGLHVPYDYARGKIPWDRNSQSPIAKYLLPRSRKIKAWPDRMWVPRGCKSLIYNPDGLLMSCLHGEANGTSEHEASQGLVLTISMRDDNPLWRQRRKVVPNWDVLPRQVWTSDDAELDWPRWETAVRLVIDETGG
jgi:hypothetical protein